MCRTCLNLIAFSKSCCKFTAAALRVCMSKQKYGQVLEEDGPFHIVLEALIAQEDDAALIARVTPEVIGYLQWKSRINTADMMPPTESGYADLLAVVLRVRGDSLGAGKIFRSLAHRAVQVDFSLRIRYLEEAIDEVSCLV